MGRDAFSRLCDLQAERVCWLWKDLPDAFLPNGWWVHRIGGLKFTDMRGHRAIYMSFRETHALWRVTEVGVERDVPD